MAKVERKPINADLAKHFAELLDKAECDLCRIQNQMFRIRLALQGVVGETVGYQYDDDTKRAEVDLHL